MDEIRVKAVAVSNGALMIIVSPIFTLFFLLVGHDDPWLENLALSAFVGILSFATGAAAYWWGSKP
jgi:hypothetical protein